MTKPRTWLAGGIAGAAGVVCYILAIAVRWPDTQAGVTTSLLVISGFPVLGIAAAGALSGFIAAERESAAGRLAFVFAVAGFVTLVAMLYVQTAVQSGFGVMAQGLDATAARALKQGLRLVDLGLDVAWDVLMSIALILWGVALRRSRGFGPAWGIPLALFGIALIALNAATFPWPPGDHGLVDLGPFCGLFMLALNLRLAFLGRRALHTATALA